MALYKGIAGSPITYLTGAMTAGQTTATVSDGTALPEAPNLCTIGFGENIETIRYGAKVGNSLSDITRGIEGVPQAWDVGTEVARFFTAYDHNELVAEITRLEQERVTHLAESATQAHLPQNVGLGNVDNVKQASKTEFDEHDSDDTRHITSVERTKWNTVDNKVDKEAGKGLSANDYTTAEKNKLAGIEAGAQVNTVTSVAGKTGAVTVSKSDVGLSNVDNVKQMPISGGVLENYREKLVTLSGTSTAINLSLGNVFTHTLTGNTTYSITNAVSGQAHSFTLIITQTATVRTLTFPASIKWQDGEIPDLTTASKTYVLTFVTVDGGSTWLGMFGGEF